MSAQFTIPIPGVSAGHAEDLKVLTGATAFVFEQPATAAVHIMGAAPGTRETELLAPENTVDEIDAIVFAGGSAFGLDAAGGVQAWLREHNRGRLLEPVRIPIVPCAILFDMRNGGDKDWGRYSPYRELGYAAACNQTGTPRLGAVGAAIGAQTATTPGGFGMAASAFANGQILSCAAVNAVGSPMIGDTRHFWAAPFEENDEFGGYGLPEPWPADARLPRTKSSPSELGVNTTLGLVVTDIALTAAEAKQVAVSAHDGFARALYPVHTAADGDLIFVVSTGRVTQEPARFGELGTLAANTMSRAIARGVYEASRSPAEHAD
ncbi:MAG: P1 family peptidase [Pseudomonadota bacterium]